MDGLRHTAGDQELPHGAGGRGIVAIYYYITCIGKELHNVLNGVTNSYHKLLCIMVNLFREPSNHFLLFAFILQLQVMLGFNTKDLPTSQVKCVYAVCDI